MGTNTSTPLIGSLKKFSLVTLALVVTVIICSTAFNFILWLTGLLVDKNGYIYETFYYFIPILVPAIISTYLFLKNKEGLGVIVIVGGILYYIWLWFGLLWMSAEAQSPIFYGLIRPY